MAFATELGAKGKLCHQAQEPRAGLAHVVIQSLEAGMVRGNPTAPAPIDWRHARHLATERGDRRRTEHGLETLVRCAAFGPQLVETLRAFPPDARNGRRLAIISDLLTAHRLIEARAAGVLRELRQSLGPVPLLRVDRRRKRRSGDVR
jgi:hypothetical protein